MHYDGSVGFWGMHMFWWIFWVTLLAGGMALFEPVSRSRNRDGKASPLEILQRRYANGEITDEEYEKRKLRIERDGVKLDLTKTNKV
jgi:putative membrane protein